MDTECSDGTLSSPVVRCRAHTQADEHAHTTTNSSNNNNNNNNNNIAFCSIVCRYPYDDGSGWVEFGAATSNETKIGIDPSVGGACPGSMDLVRGHEDIPTCTRSLTAAGAVAASYEVDHDVGAFTIDVLEYSQYYSADSFASTDGDSDIDDSYFMEGVTIASLDSSDKRHHLFSASIGIAYDTSYTAYNCPAIGCDYDDQDYCVGPKAPIWMGTNVYVDTTTTTTTTTTHARMHARTDADVDAELFPH